MEKHHIMMICCLIIALLIGLIVLIVMLKNKKDTKRNFRWKYIPTFFGLESFDFIDEISIPEYPHDNLGVTGNLILDCYKGTCIKDIFHKRYYQYCPDHRSPCEYVDESYTEHRPYIVRDCSEQCYNFNIDECNCTKEYNEKGTCRYKIKDEYEEGKICYANNAIYFWKGKLINIIKINEYTYSDNAILKDEECPKDKKYCGIIDNYGNKLCIQSKLKCPINYISENQIKGNKPYSSLSFNNKTLFYGNDPDSKDRKLFAGIFVDADIYLNKDDYEKEILDINNISELLRENKNY